MDGNTETMYGSPAEVEFCKRCVMSNQKASSSVEFKHNKKHKHKTLILEDGICDACRYAEWKDKNVDWEKREDDLIRLLEKHRRSDGRYDVLVPGSGGKDSGFASHILKYKYGMNPLTVTWAPHIYTDIGWKNFQDWIGIGGFDNVLFTPNGRVHRLLTRLAFVNLLHPFQPFIIGQKILAPKIAKQYGINLIFYGENEAEHGNPIVDNKSPLRNKNYYSESDVSKLYLSGVSLRELIDKYDLSLNDLDIYIPLTEADCEKSGIEIHYLGYYLKWTPQEAYYYSVENTGFQANYERSEGTYTKFSSLDDKIDGFHFYTTYIKFGINRATYDASKDIRNHHITREEGVALVKRFSGEFPTKYFKEFLDYIDISENDFQELTDSARPPHLWERNEGEWKLKYQVS